MGAIGEEKVEEGYFGGLGGRIRGGPVLLLARKRFILGDSIVVLRCDRSS